MAWTRLRAWLIGATLLAVLLLAPSGEAVVNNTIRVGYTVGLTGTFEHESEDVDRGYRLWEAWVNSDAYDLRLGGESYSVELVSYDDEVRDVWLTPSPFPVRCFCCLCCLCLCWV